LAAGSGLTGSLLASAKISVIVRENSVFKSPLAIALVFLLMLATHFYVPERIPHADVLYMATSGAALALGLALARH
jgi:hypothetical protein